MEAEKEVHVSLPQMLVTKMEQTAESVHIMLDELVQQAAQRYMANRSWIWLRAYGEAQAPKAGSTTEDNVGRAIHELREQGHERENEQPGH